MGLFLIINNSTVQTFLAKKITDELNDQYGTDLQISSVKLNASGNINLTDFTIFDHKNDTLIFLESLKVGPRSLKNIINNNTDLKSIELSGLNLNLIKYDQENKTNLDVFLNKINKRNIETEKKDHVIFAIEKIISNEANIFYLDQNKSEKKISIENFNFVISNLSGYLSDFSMNINELNFKNNFGVQINDFKSKFDFKDGRLILDDTKLNFINSEIKGLFVLDLKKFYRNNFLNFDDLESANIKLEIIESKIIPKDFNSIFSESLITNADYWKLDIKIEGDLNDLNINKLNLISTDDSVSFKGNFSDYFNEKKEFAFEIQEIEIKSSSNTLNSLFPSAFGLVIPSSVKNLGKFNFSGNVSLNENKIKSDFLLGVDQGIIKSSLIVNDFSNVDNSSYSGFIQGSNVDISRFLNFKSIKNTDFEFEIRGRGFTSDYLDSSIEGIIEDLLFDNTRLSGIDVFGQVKDQVFDGNLNVNDDKLNLKFNGLVDFTEELIDFDFNSKIEKAVLNELNFEDDGIISGDFDVKLRGNSLEDLIGDLKLDNVVYKKEQKSVRFGQLTAQLRNNEGDRIINISSYDIVSGIMIGEYDITNLKNSIINSFGSNYSNYSINSKLQNISFNLNFKPKLMKLLYNNLDIDENTFFAGKFSENGNYEIKLETAFLNYKDISLNNLDLDLSSSSGYITIDEIKSPLINGNNFKITTDFFNDLLSVESSYKSNNKINKLNFTHTINKNKNSLILFDDMQITLNDQRWEIDKLKSAELPTLIFDWNNKYYSFLNANFKSNDQFLAVDLINNLNESKYSIDFNNVSLENITNSANKIFFESLINGKIELIKNEDIYDGQSNLILNDLKANSHSLGDATLKINASDDLKSFVMNFNLEKESIKTLIINGNFGIEEGFFPLNLNLNMYKFDIMPFSKIGDNVITDFEGSFNSSISISGDTNEPIFNGFIKNIDVGFKIPYLDVKYQLSNNPSFQLSDQSFQIKDFELLHYESNTIGKLNGFITHNKFKDWFLDLNIDTKNLQILMTSPDDERLYYGNAFLDGNAQIKGPGESLFIDIKGSTNKGTLLTIPLKDSKNTGDLSYLNFNVNDDKKKLIGNNGLKLNLDLEFNQNADIQVILDPVSESRLNVNGFGDLDFIVNTTGNFNIYGNYVVDSGSYFYRSLGIVDREFKLKKGSTITWNGDPYLGDLNIDANYEVPGGANPAIILQNTSFNRKIPTNIDVNLTGNFNEINTPDFLINFPNTRGPIKSELDYYLVDEEKTQKQAISLLYQGTFIDEVSLASVSSQAITNNLFQKASGIIDDIFTNSEDKMNIGINYMKGDKNAASSLLNRDRLGLSLKTELSDRILINGKIGVPVSGVEDNTIIGDVQIDFLLNPSGSLKARVFNKENEYQYFANDIGYTQGLGISYEIEFDSFKELLKNSNNKKKDK